MRGKNYHLIKEFQMFRILLLLSFYFILNINYAQQNNVKNSRNKKVDSLLNVLNTAIPDTTRASIYVELSEQLYLSNIDTVLPLCLEVMKIVNLKINDANAAEKKSLLISKGNALNNIGYYYKQRGDLYMAIKWYEISLKTREKIGDKYGIANSLVNNGAVYRKKGDIKLAIDCFNKSLDIQNKIGDKEGASISLSHLGETYQLLGYTAEALENFNKSLKLQSEIGDMHGTAISFMNIGLAYSTQGNYPKAIELISKSLKILEEIGDKKGIAILLYQFGIINKEQGISFFEPVAKKKYFKKALEFYNKSLKIREESEDKTGVSILSGAIAEIYEMEAEMDGNIDSIALKYNTALEWNQKCFQLSTELSDLEGISNSLFSMGSIFLKQANLPLQKNNSAFLLKKAEEYSVAALTKAKKLNYPQNISNISKQLLIIYKKLGDRAFDENKMPAAAQYFKNAMDISTLLQLTDYKINNVESQKSILKKQMQFEFKNIENDTKQKQEDKDAIARSEKRKQLIILWFVIGGLLFILVFTFFIYQSYRQKQRLNVELEKLSIVASKTDNCVIICEPNGNIEWINEKMEKILGFNLLKWKEQGKTKLQDVSSNRDIKELINKCVLNKQTLFYDSLNITSDNKKIWMRSTLTPVLNEKGFVKKLVLIDTDITERKLTENIIQEKNKEITDSLFAGKRIQQLLLASDALLNKFLPEYFILYEPKDIVSGDFYWANVIDNKFVLITADCTGHGVPGAFMSLLNISYLNEAIIEKKIDSPDKILDYVRSRIISSLNPEGAQYESKDGMDAVLCVFDFKSLWLRFACANNPLWIVRNNDIIIFKPDKMPVGMHYGEEKNFSINTVGLRKGDIIYTFTDGYSDQFGGEEKLNSQLNDSLSGQGKKLKDIALKKILLEIQHKSMNEQKEILLSTFEKWKGNLEQVDDVLIIGIRI